MNEYYEAMKATRMIRMCAEGLVRYRPEASRLRRRLSHRVCWRRKATVARLREVQLVIEDCERVMNVWQQRIGMH